MSTPKRRSTTRKTAPKPLTPEQVRDRITELEAIGIKNHHDLVAKKSNGTASGGMWFPSNYLPDDLKAELEALRKQAA